MTPEDLLLELEQADRNVSVAPEIRAGVLRRIQGRLVRGHEVLAIDAQPLFSAGTPTLAIMKAVLASVLVVSTFGLVTAELPVSDEVQSRVRVPIELEDISVLEPLVVAAPEGSITSPSPGVQPTPKSTPARAHSRDSEEPNEAIPLPRAEFEIFAEMTSELHVGQYQRVLGLVKEHERDHPSGEYVEERLAIEARALCKSGRSHEGSQRASEFLARWPRSLQANGVHHDCGQVPDIEKQPTQAP